jgi:hypothetical protein
VAASGLRPARRTALNSSSRFPVRINPRCLHNNWGWAAVLSAYAVNVVDGLLQSLTNDTMQYPGVPYRLRAKGPSNEG